MPKVVNIRRMREIPPTVKLVDRRTIYGNPFRIGRDGNRAECLERFRQWISARPLLIEKARRELWGYDLG